MARQLLSKGSGHPYPKLERLAREVNEHTTLECVLEWGRAQHPVRRVEELVTQDEYTHDVLVPPDAPSYLAYDVTRLGAVTAVAVSDDKPTPRELLDARLAGGWRPTSSAVCGGERVLGYAACVFRNPSLDGRRASGPHDGV